MISTKFLDNLNDAVRENPVAAGLIGVGLAWMAFGGSRSVLQDARIAARTARHTVAAATDVAVDAAEPVAGAIERVRESAVRMRNSVSDGAKVAVSKVNEAVGVGSATTAREPDDYDDASRQSLGRDLVDFLERQPLALAAVGAAVGAAIATAFPKTAAEDRLIGGVGVTLRERAGDAASTMSDRVAAAVAAATDEAVAQDLTLEAAKEAARAGVGKLKNVAKAGIEAAR